MFELQQFGSHFLITTHIWEEMDRGVTGVSMAYPFCQM